MRRTMESKWMLILGKPDSIESAGVQSGGVGGGYYPHDKLYKYVRCQRISVFEPLSINFLV